MAGCSEPLIGVDTRLEAALSSMGEQTNAKKKKSTENDSKNFSYLLFVVVESMEGGENPSFISIQENSSQGLYSMRDRYGGLSLFHADLFR